MRRIKYIVAGIFFGIIMVKSEAVSWWRIQELFRFQSFFMYGIIGSAVLTGIVLISSIKRHQLRDIHGRSVKFPDKEPAWKKYLIGGSVFGIGWAFTGACPGPVFVLLGAGYGVMVLVIAGALTGTVLYGLLRDRLPR